MSKLSFADTEYAIKKRTTRREKFLAQLEQLAQWQKLNQQLIKDYKKPVLDARLIRWKPCCVFT